MAGNHDADYRVPVIVAGTQYLVWPATAELIESLASKDDANPTEV